MSDVSFDEPTYKTSYAVTEKRSSSLTSLAIKSGLARSPKEAQVVLGIVGVLLLIGAGWFYYAHTSHLPSQSEARRIHPELDALNPVAH